MLNVEHIIIDGNQFLWLLFIHELESSIQWQQQQYLQLTVVSCVMDLWSYLNGNFSLLSLISIHMLTHGLNDTFHKNNEEDKKNRKSMTPKYHQCRAKYYAKKDIISLIMNEVSTVFYVKFVCFPLPLLYRSFVEYVHRFQRFDWLSPDF